jgi:cell division protein FtsI/penicillin-binding protein 2
VIDKRIGFLFAVFLLLLAGAGARAGWLGVVRHGPLEAAANVQQEVTSTIPARRGSITDVKGQELAVSEPAFTIAATPYLIKDPQRAAARLARVLKLPESRLLRELTRSGGFAYVARKVPAGRARRAQALDIAGLEFIPEFRRVYPLDWSASQVLGMVGTDGKGLAGLEYQLDRYLRGRDGSRHVRRDAMGDAIETTEPKRARAGADVRLTLDAAIQEHTEAVLKDVGRKWRPLGATAIVMDPRDGSILALANWPQINANAPGSAPPYATQNRAVQTTYEPGSTYKAFTVASALEDGQVETDTIFTLPPTLKVADRVIRESHEVTYGQLSTKGILEKSSNVGAVKIGLSTGRKRFHQWIGRWGFGAATGVDLPGEEIGQVLPLKDYSDSTMGNLPIGQGIAVTPMQMAVGYAAIANGGVLRPPHIVAAVSGRRTPTPAGQRVISEDTAEDMRIMLKGVLGPGGTASGAAIKGYELAGKTGTAQKPEKGGYSSTKYVASFVGFAPAENPQLLVSVMVDEPKGDIYGGAIAAPAFKQITEWALNYRQIPPD